MDMFKITDFFMILAWLSMLHNIHIHFIGAKIYDLGVLDTICDIQLPLAKLFYAF